MSISTTTPPPNPTQVDFHPNYTGTHQSALQLTAVQSSTFHSSGATCWIKPTMPLKHALTYRTAVLAFQRLTAVTQSRPGPALLCPSQLCHCTKHVSLSVQLFFTIFLFLPKYVINHPWLMYSFGRKQRRLLLVSCSLFKSFRSTFYMYISN